METSINFNGLPENVKISDLKSYEEQFLNLQGLEHNSLKNTLKIVPKRNFAEELVEEVNKLKSNRNSLQGGGLPSS